MKKAVFLLLLLLLLPCFVAAQRDELFEYHALDLRLRIDNSFDVEPSGRNFFIESVTADLSWYPLDDYRQQVELITTDPASDFDEDKGFVFTWDRPKVNSFSFSEESKVRTRNEFMKVKSRVAFPVVDLDPAYAAYLKPGEIIDINDDIRRIAAGLVSDEDDLFVVTVKLAEWVEDNVIYNLSTMTADANQKSSWVLLNKQGVCDEITSLFISLCRSVGIPARFVTGLSYSNINLQNDGWGPHGWAEVYFPGQGWVPFDVTYKEFGYIDAAHIKLKTTFDAKETSTDYLVRGTGTSIIPGKLGFEVTVVGRDYKIKPAVILKAEVAKSNVGFGSYNLLTVTITNNNNYYVTSRLYLSNVNELEIIGDTDRDVTLAPSEAKKAYWLIKTSSSLDSNYVYTFPLSISGPRAEEADISFKADRGAKIYSEEYIRSLVPDEKQPGIYDDELVLSCASDKDEIYLEEEIKVSCTAKNTGSSDLRGLNICLASDCAMASIGSGNDVTREYTHKFSTLGVKTLIFRAYNGLVDKSYYLIIDVQDAPLIKILNLSYPESVKFDEQSAIVFRLRQSSSSVPLKIKATLDHELIKEEWTIASLESDYELRFLFKGENLKLKDNDFKVTISYDDRKGKHYTEEKTFSIELENPTFTQKIAIWINVMDRKLSQWFSGLL